MSWLKKGPELKKPNLEAPPFLSDLYYDLRDRRLLPILALAVVAIAAVPFILGGGSEEEAPTGSPGSGGGPAVANSSGAGAAHFTVVESKPGLRDYHKRLARRKPTDPFKQRYTEPVLRGAELNPQTEGSSGSTTTYTTPTTETSGSTLEPSTGGAPPSSSPSGHPPSTSDGGGDDNRGLTFFAFAIDVRISKSEPKDSAAKSSQAQEPVAKKSEEKEPTVRHRVLPLTKLPGDKAPVVTYMGPSKQGNPLFLVSGKVASVFGESKCVSGDDVCQLLEVEPTFPVVFVYGANEVHYTINVLKIELVSTGHS